MRTLIDTNILLRSGDRASSQHADAADAVAALSLSGRAICISSQSVYEFLAVAAKPVGENGLGLAQADADSQLAKLLTPIEILCDSAAIATELRRLVVAHKVVGKKIHDARMVATMNAHNIIEILTFNAKDFTRYPAITLLSPSLVALGQLPALPPYPSSPSNSA